jgi:DNA recombination protein RmuC
MCRKTLKNMISYTGMEILLLIVGFVTLGILAYTIQKINAHNLYVSQNIELSIEKLKNELSQQTGAQKDNIQEKLDAVKQTLENNLKHSSDTNFKQGEQIIKLNRDISVLIEGITKELTEVKQSSKTVAEYGSQLQELQNILKNPKQRGVLGEFWLETLLDNVLPHKNLYSMQYTIGNNEHSDAKLIADAAIFLDNLIIPIDAKFSLENFNRMMAEQNPSEREKLEKAFKADVKKRIDETAKYVNPDLGTTSFAFMFIPAEGVFYSLLNSEVGSTINSVNLIEYAFEKKVMIVSPTSFYAYLQTVLLGLKKLEIEKSTQDIIKKVAELGKHFKMYSDIHDRLGKNLKTVVTQYNQSSGEVKKISKDVIRITSGTNDDLIEIDTIEKPMLED